MHDRHVLFSEQSGTWLARALGMRIWPLLLLSFLGCSRGVEPERQSVPEPKGDVSAPSQRKAEVTPELARKAEEILRENEAAGLGTEIPFVFDGRRYVARIEEHDNPSGEPGRPQGKHKGLTVYVAP
jgi:hypothetical protein